MSKRRTKPYSAPPFSLVHHPEDEQVVTLPVNGFRQARNYSCGFATTLMVLGHFGRNLCGLELFEALGTARDGTGQTAIVQVLRSQGLRANLRYDVGFERIARSINDDKLLIAYLADEEHWLVIYGYGRAPERIFVADPEPEKPCEQKWADYGERLGRFAIVCSLSDAAAEQPAACERKPMTPSQLSFDFRGEL